MPSYKYKGRDKFGVLTAGVISADSETSVSLRLKEMGLTPVEIRAGVYQINLSRFGLFVRRVGPADLGIFTRQFSTLQKAGLTLLISLLSLHDQADNPQMKRVLASVIRDVEGGMSLSGAMVRHPDVFGPLYVNMIEASESSGRLDEALEHLAELGEHEESVRRRMVSATRYPLLVLLALTAGFVILTTMVVPRFAAIYSQFTAALPLPTRLLLFTHVVLTRFWWVVLILAVIVAAGGRRYLQTGDHAAAWDGLKLKIPVFGPLLLKISMSRFSRITATLVTTGVSILKALDLAAGGSGNLAISRTIQSIKAGVIQGQSMTVPMRASGIFPPMVVQMVAVGEGTGRLPDLLMHVSRFYDSQVDYTIANIISLIEPFLIAVLGFVVTIMALGIFMPMWNLMSLFRH